MNLNQYDIPLTLPVTAQDRFEYPLRYVIHVVVSFDQALDHAVLDRAVRLSLDAEPILGCHFVEDNPQPYWQRFNNLDDLQWFEWISADEKDAVIERFVKSSFFHESQQINVCHIHAADGDTLVVKMSHGCCDAGGLKEYLVLLADIYTHLLENPVFYPPPHIQGRRDQKNYFAARGINDPLALFDPQYQPPPPTWAFPWHSRETNQMHLALRRFKNDAFDRILSFAKDYNVTITTVLLAAMFRALFAMLQPPIGEEMDINVSVDLRHAFTGHLDQAISNLSVGMHPRISRMAEESFAETLQRASAALQELKQNRAESIDAIGLEVWAMTDYSTFLEQLRAILEWSLEIGKNNPLLSNVGVIPPLHFGQSRATDAYMLTPVVFPPSFMLGVTTYDRTLTMQCSFGEPGHRREDVERFMDLMEKELSQC